MEVSAPVGASDKKAWEQHVSTITGGMATKALGGNANKPKPAELTDEQKQNNELMKSIQNILANMERDQRTFFFIRVSSTSKSKVPAPLVPWIANHNKVNQT
jgi:hypothetical protein